MDEARAQWRSMGLDSEQSESAAVALEQWLGHPQTAADAEAIRVLLDRNPLELWDSFRMVLPFGTGGRRGHVGLGPNRINPTTVARTAAGHALWMRRRRPSASSVVLAWDTRRFDDLEGRLGQAGGRLQGWTSEDLARVAGEVYSAEGLSVWWPETDGAGWPTPLLSYAVRALGADAGMVISASHNPPDDNGVKVYDHRGGQVVPPDDESLLEAISGVQSARRVGVVGRPIPPTIMEDWSRAVAGTGGRAPVHVLVTPLHGTGRLEHPLRRAGATVRILADQARPDGAFPTVPGGVANPERPEVLDLAIKAAREEEVLVFGTDPDADRLGVAVRTDAGWKVLDGQAIAALVVDGSVPDSEAGELVVRTLVTSSLVDDVARSRGASVQSDLLVGFKFIADGIRALEEEGSWKGHRDVHFCVGVEESHGVLTTDAIRDKDAACGAVAIARAAAAAHRHGQTLVSRLTSLEHQFGAAVHRCARIRLDGPCGAARCQRLMDEIRANRPQHWMGLEVQSWEDLADPEGPRGAHRSQTDRAARNLLCATLVARQPLRQGQVVLRPSGTEPVRKAYLEFRGYPGEGEFRRQLEAGSERWALEFQRWAAG